MVIANFGEVRGEGIALMSLKAGPAMGSAGLRADWKCGVTCSKIIKHFKTAKAQH